MNRILAIGAACALCSCAMPCAGATHRFFGQASGFQSIPPLLTDATAELDGVYDDVQNRFWISWRVIGQLNGNPATPGLHIHRAPQFEIGPQVFVMSTGAWPLEGHDVWHDLSEFNVSELFAGHMYVNFHTDAHPGGEIRGNLFLVPAPSATALFVCAAPCALARRRRPGSAAR